VAVKLSRMPRHNVNQSPNVMHIVAFTDPVGRWKHNPLNNHSSRIWGLKKVWKSCHKLQSLKAVATRPCAGSWMTGRPCGVSEAR
jgi:hypothetical protein